MGKEKRERGEVMSSVGVTRSMAKCCSSSKMSVCSGRVSVVKPASRSTSRVVARAAEREMWYPGAVAPKHLDGSMAGECSLLMQAPFDPLKLKTEETKLKEL